MDASRKVLGGTTQSTASTVTDCQAGDQDPPSSCPSISSPEEARTEMPLVRSEELPFAVGVVCDRGTRRSRNEDAAFCLQSVLTCGSATVPFGIFMIADGLGGHEDGQIASELAIRTVAAHLLKTIYVPMLASQVQGSQSAPINESLFDGMEAANEAIKRGTDGGGSTLTAVLVLGRTAYIAHIGDSRAYLIEGSSVSQITQDHSLVARLMEIQHLTAEQAAEYGQRNVLYKALGQGLAPEPDIYYHPLNHGAHLLLCSDGLWSVLSQQDILAAIDENRGPQAVCAHLLSLAIDRGSDDNVSVIMLSSKE